MDESDRACTSAFGCERCVACVWAWGLRGGLRGGLRVLRLRELCSMGTGHEKNFACEASI